MPSINWSSFFISSPVASTVVHFLLSSRNSSAPYPVACRFEVFGVGFPKRAAVVEGARLQQPDGIRLEDLIPELKGAFTGLLGFNLELSLTQSHADLRDSKCYVEINIANELVRFEPRPKLEKITVAHDLILADETSTYSLIAVNSGLSMQPLSLLKPENTRYRLFPLIESQGACDQIQLSPWSVVELGLSDQDLIAGVQDLATRKVKLGQVSMELTPDLSSFLVCRDRHNKRLLSVRAL